MKKLLASVILCCLLVIMCGGCGENNSDEPVTITVLMDVFATNSPLSKHDKRNFRDVVNHYYPDKNIVLEYELLTSDPIERQAQLANIRTEIMAGGGPDVFILPTWTVEPFYEGNGTSHKIRHEPVFTDVENAMRNRIFLPLNDYIAKSDHYKSEEHISIIMDAGIVDGNQYVMPLLFDYGLAILNSDYIGDSLEGYYEYEKYYGDPLPGVGNTYSSLAHKAIGKYVDHDNEQLIITENELASLIEDICGLWRQIQAVGEDEPLVSCGSVHIHDLFNVHASNGKLVPLAVPNRDNGITAHITAFAAVNANSEHPEEAFNIIELFFSEELQDDAGVRIEELEGKRHIPFDNSASVGAGSGVKTGVFNYVEYNYPTCWEQINDMHARIDHVEFISEMDCLLYDACNQLEQDLWDGKEIDYQAVAAELYSKWKMMVAE